MTVFMENGNHYNLLNSAVLELVDFIRRANIKVCSPVKGLAAAFKGPCLRSIRTMTSKRAFFYQQKQCLVSLLNLTLVCTNCFPLSPGRFRCHHVPTRQGTILYLCSTSNFLSHPMRSCQSKLVGKSYPLCLFHAQPLIEHLVTHYSHRFAEIDYVETFKLLHIKYEQQQVRRGSNAHQGDT